MLQAVDFEKEKTKANELRREQVRNMKLDSQLVMETRGIAIDIKEEPEESENEELDPNN